MKSLLLYNNHESILQIPPDDKLNVCVCENIGEVHYAYPYDSQIEYLQSTGTQWIDTGFKHDQNTRFVAKFEVLNVTYNQSRWIDPFGSWGDVKAASGTNYGKMKGIESNPSNGRWQSYYGIMGKSKALSTSITRYGIHTIDFNKNVHTMDGYSVTHDAQTFTSKYNDVIFGVTNYNGIGNCGGCYRFFYFKIYDNGILIRDFIPIRIRNIGYMYDKVSGQLFGNSGTGIFTLGPDI